jgi:hypothetical protein
MLFLSWIINLKRVHICCNISLFLLTLSSITVTWKTRCSRNIQSPTFLWYNIGPVRVRVTLRFKSVSHYVLVSSPLCGRLTRYCFLFKCVGLKYVVLSLWGALSDERPDLSFVSHSLIIGVCVHLLFTFLSFITLSYIYIYIYIYISFFISNQNYSDSIS